MNLLATFSGAKYWATTKRIVEDAPRFGVDAVWVYDDHWLRNCRPGYWEKTKYFREHHQARGVDWFCFKPMYILEAFRRLNPGDILLAVDADTFPVCDLLPLYHRCRANGGQVMFNARGCHNRQWTKRDCFTLMGCDKPAYHYVDQTVARFMLLEKGGAFPWEEFLGKWLGFTANPILNTFDPSILGLPEYPDFREHRTEQSVLSCLSIEYGVKLHREACEFGGWDGPARDCEIDIGHQFFSQVGDHSFRPGYSGDESEGSSFRNVVD